MQKIKITGRKHHIIKHAVSILNSSKTREQEGLFLAEGARLCEDAANSDVFIKRLFYTEKAFEKYCKYIEKIEKKSEEIYIIEEQAAQLLSDTKSSQGIFALCAMPKSDNGISGKVLVMENLQDPGNIGTIFRTAEALGISTLVLLGDCCDIYSPKLIRSTMGAIFRVNFVKYKDFYTLQSELKSMDYSCYAAVPNNKSEKVGTVFFKEKSAVFIGNEGNGLSSLCISSFQNITIPMNGNAESLNASVAASIIMWEMVKCENK